MNKIAIFGANGRMGRVLIDALDQAQNATLSAAYVRATSTMMGVDVGELAGIGAIGLTTSTQLEQLSDAQVLIDFTSIEATLENIQWCQIHNNAR